ncbi:CAP domain-containing protein [Streptomyces sp. NPDC096193]|uniref:CAP domain-containing protein n=1 Tax=Streptomyces sp. NPDC096193 TaxID=3155821 RepID=UPI00332906E4
MGRHRRSAKRAGRPVRTGLLGVSAAVAVGAVIVASGLLPGGDTSIVGGESSPTEQVRTEGSARLQTQGDASAEPTPETSSPASPTSPTATPPRPKAPAKSPAQKRAKPVKPAEPTKPAKPKAEPSAKAPAPKPVKPSPEKSKKEKKESAPTRTESRAPDRAPDRQKPVSSSSEAAAEAEVLNLVNEERSKVGCSPVRTDAPLAALAGAFSKDMAGRGFFDHTDPDGDSPWVRAAQSGVNNLGAENIARGQADASAVMNSWMNSEGHRANILNCDYKSLGVGVHMADGGPWWTQDFGF